MAQTRDSIQVEFRFGHVVLDGRPLASVWLGEEPKPRARDRVRDIDRVLERMLEPQIRDYRCKSSISFRREGGRVLWTRMTDADALARVRAIGELTA
jgi:hypothetical protein